MRQILFTIPVFPNWFPPDGIPVYGFGAMLVIAFIAVTWWGSRRATRANLPPAKFQDMALWLIISGIIGARVLYMIQYSHQFGDRSIPGLAKAFFQIWRGGIIFYGSALGGAIGYGFFYWFVLRRMRINGWQLADAVAPLLALGLAIGRIGCYLNGCCWGQVACEETCPVPLGTVQFPLLPAHARDQLVSQAGLQTSTGFAITPRGHGGGERDDPRSVVAAVEPGSPAAVAGLRVGDRIVSFNGLLNRCVLEFAGPSEKVAAALDVAEKAGGTAHPAPAGEIRPPWADFDTPATFRQAQGELARGGLAGTILTATDSLDATVRWDWPRGKNPLELTVLRDGKDVTLPSFTPRTVGLYPTQLYETVSMILLIGVLLALYPLRRHDGQLMTMLMLGYGVHRFINESLRIEPTVGLGLTLSQWGSVVIFTGGMLLEVFLWVTMPSRWRRPAPGA